jgi:hypothetical protein
MLLAASGCMAPTHRFTLSKERPLYDVSAVRPQLPSKHISKLIVLHSSGTDSSRFEELQASFEREFLRNGVTVISGAVTGRVVLGLDNTERKTETAAQLTDLERALVMAQKTGADAILQIGEFSWLEPVEGRYLVYDEGKGVREVTRSEYLTFPSERRTFVPSGASQFTGRLVDVSNGELLASFKVACAVHWSLPDDVSGTVTIRSTAWTFENENLPLLPWRAWDAATGIWAMQHPEWEPQARRRCDQRIVERLISLSLSKERPPPETAAPVFSL